MAIPLESAASEPHVQAKAGRAPHNAIDPARSLALSDFAAPETTAGERLIRLAYRLGVPGPTLVAPFR